METRRLANQNDFYACVLKSDLIGNVYISSRFILQQLNYRIYESLILRCFFFCKTGLVLLSSKSGGGRYYRCDFSVSALKQHRLTVRSVCLIHLLAE